jgi:hypothetical protein
MSGDIDSKRIIVFNWTTMSYSLQKSKLSANRELGTCAILKGNNGEKLVAVASGYSKGIEVWNPADGSVKTLNSTFPPNGSVSRMIAVNGNTELIFYESNDSPGRPQGIWKFSQVLRNLLYYTI